MHVWINGERRELAAGASVLDALTAADVPRQGVAVAVDGAVVRRSDWSSTPVPEGARVEVLTAVQGG